MEDGVESQIQQNTQKTKHQPKRKCDFVFKVHMPVLPPGAGAEADAAGTRSVSVMGHGTNQIYIAVDDVDSLIAYVAKCGWGLWDG